MLPPTLPRARSALRTLLVIGGAATGIVAAVAYALARPHFSLAWGALFTTAVTGVLLGALSVVPIGLRALGAIVLGITGYLFWTWSYTVVAFPFVDMIRPWGMDKGPYPVVRPMLGLLLLLAVTPLALGAPDLKAWRARAARLAGFLSCALVVGWWSYPSYYEMDLINESGIYPDMPHFLPRPGVTGPGSTPVYVKGKIEYLHWTEYAFVTSPAKGLPYIAYRERVLADIAHGMHEEAANARVAAGGESPATARFRSTVRAAGWTTAKLASDTFLTTQVLTLPVLVWLAYRFVRGRPGGVRERRALQGLLWALALFVPTVNLALVTLFYVSGMPDVARRGGTTLVETMGLLLAVLGIGLGGRVLAQGANDG